MQPSFSLALYRSEPNKRAGTCANAFSATTPIHYLPICIPPRPHPNIVISFYRSKSLNQILPEKTPDVYGGIDVPPGGNKKKGIQERMVRPIEPDKFFVVAFDNRAPQNTRGTRRFVNGPPTGGKAPLVPLLKSLRGCALRKRPDLRASNFCRMGGVAAGRCCNQAIANRSAIGIPSPTMMLAQKRSAGEPVIPCRSAT